ncbi:MAG: acyltransferase [Verrucomicrobiales bacterium]|nr:acyltransferase [Verrucomicrobiales bacterium]
MAAQSRNSSHKFKLALVQMSCSDDVEANLVKAEKLITQAAEGGAKLVCLQELFASIYFCQNLNHEYFGLAESIPGPLTERFAALAGKLGIVLLLPVYEKRAPGLYFNSCAVIDADGSLLGVYRKMHIPHDPQFEEKFYFAPGDLGFKAWDTAVGRIGVLICWDQWYPEGARLTALRGAEILFFPTAIGWLAPEKAEYGERQYQSWEIIQRSHAVANGCYVAAPNRCGHEAPNHSPGIEFWGRSFVADPSGQMVAQAGTESDEVLFADIDLDEVRAQREVWPFLRDRRVDAYGDLTQRFLG